MPFLCHTTVPTEFEQLSSAVQYEFSSVIDTPRHGPSDNKRTVGVPYQKWISHPWHPDYTPQVKRQTPYKLRKSKFCCSEKANLLSVNSSHDTFHTIWTCVVKFEMRVNMCLIWVNTILEIFNVLRAERREADKYTIIPDHLDCYLIYIFCFDLYTLHVTKIITVTILIHKI